ncbi:hypothetical protein [Streptomyces sp. NPDC054887]
MKKRSAVAAATAAAFAAGLATALAGPAPSALAGPAPSALAAPQDRSDRPPASPLPLGLPDVSEESFQGLDKALQY